MSLNSEFLMNVSIELRPDSSRFGDTPYGVRVTGFGTGTFNGPKLNGFVLPGSGDWYSERPDGVGIVDVRAILKTDDEALIYLHYMGILNMSTEQRERLRAGEPVDRSEYYFRTTPYFQTGSEKYHWLNNIVSVGVGTRTQTGVEYDIYEVT